MKESSARPLGKATALDRGTCNARFGCAWFEIAGLRTSAAEGAEFDAIYHETPAFREFGRLSNEQGLKSALAWRDDPFGDGRGAIRRE